MRHIAIVGSGPAGFYTAEAACKQFGDGVRVDIIDRLPTPYGLIRAGVAPDHQSIKAVSRRYDEVATDSRVRFLGGVTLGEQLAVGELMALYDDVILAVGAPEDRALGVEGDGLPGVIGSSAFVGWYNGHPDQRHLDPPLDATDVAIVGNGNVAIDCARILAKTVAELQASDIVNHALEPLSVSKVARIHIIGRRGPHQASFTLKEVGELGELDRATPILDPDDFPPAETDSLLDSGQRRVVEKLRGFLARPADPEKPVAIHFHFFRRPLRVVTGADGRAAGLELMRTRLDDSGRAVDTGETEVLSASLILSAIGYRTSPIAGVPFDAVAGRFHNMDGLIAPGLWCVGWARRGPTGTIGTNRTDGYALVARLADHPAPGGRAGGAGLDALLEQRGIQPVQFADWRRIDAHEVARARAGAPREKIVDLSELRQLVGHG